MSNIFVRSTDGADVDNGSTWALAKATLSGAAAIDAAGDTIFVSDNHAEGSNSDQTIALAGTLTNPVRVLCVDDAGDPASPTTIANTGSVAVTGNSTDIIVSGCGFIQGLIFSAGTGTNSTNTIQLLSSATVGSLDLVGCKLRLASTGTGSYVTAGYASTVIGTRVKFADTWLKFAASTQHLRPHGAFIWSGGGFEAGTTSPTYAFNIGNASFHTACTARLRDLDFSALGTGFNWLNFTGSPIIDFQARNIKLPSGWAGAVLNTALNAPKQRVSLYNCDSGDTNYRVWIEDYSGVIRDETTIVRTGGASDGGTSISWKMTTNSGSSEIGSPLMSDPILVWNSATGSAVTITAEIITDSATNLTDAEVWLEVEYLGTSGYPLGSILTDQRATVLTTAADQADSLSTWTTTGMSNPNPQKLDVTITPQEAGWIQARVVLAKASTTIYACPKLTVA